MTNAIIVTNVLLEGNEGDQGLFFGIKRTIKGETITSRVSSMEVITLIRQGETSWTCVNENAVEYFNQVITSNDVKYYTLEEDSDGSGEHDVYVHRAFVENGELKFDIGGEHVKTYKRLSYARKFLADLQAAM